jgi:NTP pyrophosphatase (non-canonical NTP hydrolase)
VTIRELQDVCYEDAMRKGWVDRVIPIPEMIALIHSEVSEALEAFRNHEPLSWTEEDSGKPQGLASEFADIIIRIGHYASYLNIDLTAELTRKMAYNRTRPYRHGGKVI